jgi:tricorn protease-like protein
VADHCSQDAITILDLSSGATTILQPPDGLAGFRVLGNARFSPDGHRLAYALAKNNPDEEQGWVAVSEGTQSSSTLILTASAGVYYTVIGWLDEQTLLVQSTPSPGCEGCGNKLWTVNIDGSNLVEVAVGSFLAVIDNRIR